MTDEDELFASLEEGFAAILDEVEIPFPDWEDFELLREWTRLNTELQKRNEVLWPRTAEARDLHSRRNAVQLVLIERGLK